MKPPVTRPLQTLAAALAVLLAACGGGGSTSTETPAPEPDPPPAAPAPAFVSTAYLKTENTVLYAGKTYGLARAGVQAQVDQCNGFRDVYYGLPPLAPPEALLAKLDVSVHEKFFDTDKALTLITGTYLELPDVQRWLAELKAGAASGTVPPVPLDCAVVQESERKTGTLWRDGNRYELRYSDLKAVGTQGADTKTALGIEAEFRALPGELFLGKSCRVVAAPAGTLSDSKSCIWDDFPYEKYLNFPYALSALVQFGPTPGLMETIKPLEVARGKAIAASVFAIPDGFTVTLD